jgi:tetratricopeptide (TPR) repeat protein
MKNIYLFISISLLLFACKAQNDVAWQEQAEQYFNKNQYNEAVEFLEEQLFTEPANQELHYYLGQAYKVLACNDGSKMNNINPELAIKSADHFKRVIEISPNYNGKQFVVGPYSKLQNEWASLAFKYLFDGKVDSAKWAFETGQADGGFFPAIMEYNKNIMASCKPNAIIFTNGDNDTYPMWFLQFIDNYRQDITIVNLSLLNVPWYIKQLKNNYLTGTNNLKINLSDEDIDQLAPKLWEEKKVTVPLNKKGNIEWIVMPTIEEKAIRVQDIMVMEILETNNWERPIYFSTTVANLNKIGLGEYLSLEGLVYRLETHKQDVNPGQLEKNLMETYAYNTMDDHHIKNVPEIGWMFWNYRAGYVRLASYFRNEGNIEKAKTVFETMNNKIPEDKIPYHNKDFKNEIEKLTRELNE